MSASITIIAAIPEPSPDDADPSLRPDEIECGQWFWVTTKSGKSTETWLGCVTRLGSNYAKLVEPAREGRGGSSARVHFDDFYDHCVWVPNATEVIAGYVAHHKSRLDNLMLQMKEVTARLGMAPTRELRGTGDDACALSTTLSGKSYGDYKAELVKAKKEELPAIFEAIKNEHEQLAKWMSAELLPLKSSVHSLERITEGIEARIFNVELYAGLVEEIVKVRDGKPAALGEPLTLVQRRLYMDEECLAMYSTGGMQFKHIEAFDEWIARDENMLRLLPFARCMVAFRVRRYDIKRECRSFEEFISLWYEHQDDRRTFLYIRNGDSLYRMSTGVDFGEHLFPDIDRAVLASGVKLWALYVGGDLHDLITDHDRTERLRVRREEKQAAEQQYADLAAQPCTCTFVMRDKRHTAKWCDACDSLMCWTKKFDSHADRHNDADARMSLESWMGENGPRKGPQYEPFDKTSVYYDDIVKWRQDQIDAHNRIALIVQGLLDRSPVLHPHPPWQIWTKEGYEQALNLVFDSDRALTPCAAPDFEAYRKRLNASLAVGCVTVGQRNAWEEHRKEERENDGRKRRFWADHGPDVIHEVKGLAKRGAVCRYEWTREANRAKKTWVPDPKRPNWGHWDRIYGRVPVHIDVHADAVLNVNAYVPGDFKQFFDDPRTRAEYMQWAPFLLAAEEWHAGNKEGVPQQKSETTASQPTEPSDDDVDDGDAPEADDASDDDSADSDDDSDESDE